MPGRTPQPCLFSKSACAAAGRLCTLPGALSRAAGAARTRLQSARPWQRPQSRPKPASGVGSDALVPWQQRQRARRRQPGTAARAVARCASAHCPPPPPPSSAPATGWHDAPRQGSQEQAAGGCHWQRGGGGPQRARRLCCRCRQQVLTHAPFFPPFAAQAAGCGQILASAVALGLTQQQQRPARWCSA